MNNLEKYLTQEEKAVVRQAQEIMDKAMCRALTEQLGVEVAYVNEHTISVNGEEMNEEQFAHYLQQQSSPEMVA